MKLILLSILLLFLSLNTALADNIVLLGNNFDSLRARVDHIQAAEHEIKAQYFSIDKDNISFTALALFRDAAKRGVKVKIIVDSMHNMMKPETMAALLNNLNPKESSNIKIRVYNAFNLFRPFRYTKRMHDKGIIVDNKVMISGGRNIANGYFGKITKKDEAGSTILYEDSDALIFNSTAIQTASAYFDDLWNSRFVDDVALYDFDSYSLSSTFCSHGERDSYSCESRQQNNITLVKKEEERLEQFIFKYKQSQVENQYVPLNWMTRAIEVSQIEFLYDDVKTQKSNLDKPDNNVAARLYSIIAAAEKTVTIVTPYLVVTPEQESLFRKLREKNIKVQVFTNSKGSNDVAAAHVGYEKTRDLALNLGVEIFEYQGPDTLHAKMVLIDDKTVFIGSFNWDFRSQNLNREVGIVAQLPQSDMEDFSSDVYEKFARIMGNSCQINTNNECKPISNIQLADMDTEEYSRLVEIAKRREKDNATFYRIFFPLIKGQL